MRILALALLAGCALVAQPAIVATGLPGAQKMILTPGGNFLVSEPSIAPNGGRVSFVTRGGARRSLLEGLPSGIEVTLAGGGGPSAMALHGRTLYLAIGNGDAERRGTTPGTSLHNPAGMSSPLFATVLAFAGSNDIDLLQGPFTLTRAQQTMVADGGTAELTDERGDTVRVSLLARFPVSEPDRNTIYRFSNPWGLLLADEGRSLYVSDASMNSIARVDTATGRWRRLVRFEPFSTPPGTVPPVTDSVPTSIRQYGSELLVSFLSGFPFTPGAGRVVLFNPETGAISPFIPNMTSVVDVAWRERPEGAAQFFVLEFSRNQSATPPAPGRLVMFDTARPGPQTLVETLITPVSMVIDEAANELYVLEMRGQIVRVPLP